MSSVSLLFLGGFGAPNGFYMNCIFTDMFNISRNGVWVRIVGMCFIQLGTHLAILYRYIGTSASPTSRPRGLRLF